MLAVRSGSDPRPEELAALGVSLDDEVVNIVSGLLADLKSGRAAQMGPLSSQASPGNPPQGLLKTDGIRLAVVGLGEKVPQVAAMVVPGPFDVALESTLRQHPPGTHCQQLVSIFGTEGVGDS